MKYDVINLENQKVESIDLSDAIFGVEVRSDILSRVVNWQLAKRRAGTHSVKNLSTVSGTTKKPFRQKGTGRGRQGTLRAPEFRHGAVAFGPVVRSHEHDLNKKIRKLGLKCALSSKVKDGKLFILDAAKAATPKTKEMKNAFDKLGWTSALILGGAELDKNFALASGNIVGIDVLADAGANVYDILRRDTLVLTKETVSYLEALLK
ncbi:MAG: 50S ribosomal protein L4 [Alphaproteobacteria bacterium]|nr:50S ribosomal protein L4 [Alphaproteobacteria bacterium]